MFVLGCLLAPLPDGGAQWGPRMLLPALPALLIAALGGVAGALTRRGPQQIAAIAALTLAISAGGFSQGTGILKIRESNRNVVALTTAVVQSKAQVIISDTVSAPALLAQIFYTGPQIYWTDTPASFDTLITTLARAHTTDFYYISASQQNQADAQRWRDLIPIGQPERLPYGWSGQRYQIVGP
jgi:hypothetical protein